jgi:hypothetical protein
MRANVISAQHNTSPGLLPDAFKGFLVTRRRLKLQMSRFISQFFQNRECGAVAGAPFA